MTISMRHVLVAGPVAGGLAVRDSEALSRVKRVGTVLCFMAFPMIWVLAFAVHPQATGGRWHYVSLPYTVGLGRAADINAARFEGEPQQTADLNFIVYDEREHRRAHCGFTCQTQA